jgi:ABC-2 type transport system permease protein
MRGEDGSLVSLVRARILGALARRDFLIARSYRATFTLDLFFGAMNLVIFYFISRTVSLRAETLQGAPTYFAFASVGIVLTVVMQASTTGLARRIREEQLTGTLEVLAVQPISSVEMAGGLAGFSSAFGVVRAAFYLAFAGIVLGLDTSITDFAGLTLIIVATGLTLSAIGVFLGAIVLILKQGETLAAITTFGLGLLSGALFPRELLPEWLQALGDILPTRFALDGMRRALFEGDGWEGDLLALLITAVVLIPLSVAFFSYVLRVVKRAGSLSQY